MRQIIIAAVLGAGLALGGAGSMGPPGICNTIEVGDASSTLDAAWKGVTKGNLPERLPGVLDQFAANTSARMEVLRRAVFLDTDQGEKIVGALSLRALEQEAAASKAAPSALFDVGYAIHLYHTMDSDAFKGRALADNIVGYQLVKHAIEKGGDSAMHVGAAYMTLPAMQPRIEERVAKARELFNSHCEAALKAYPPGSVEERNLAFVLNIEGQKVETIRTRLTKQ